MDTKKIQFKIEKHCCVLAEKPSGWSKELNRVSWNGGEVKWDIREWNKDHTRCGKGITFTDDEIQILAEYLNDEGEE